MKRSLTLAAFAVLAAAPLAAQDSTPPAHPMPMQHMMGMMGTAGPMMPNFAWFLTVGALRSDWGDVATTFNAVGYNAPATTNVAVGFGGYGVRRRFIIGGEGNAYTGQSVSSSGGREVRAVGGGAFFNLGYALLERPKVRAYPFVGVGGLMTTFRVDQASGTGLGPQNNSPGFGQVLQSPGRRSVMSAGGLGLEFGAGVDFVPFMRHTSKGMYGLLLGVRAGYQYVPVRSDWKLYNEVTLTGGPDNIANGFFVRFSIGGAGRKGHPGMMGGACPMMGGMQGGACPMMGQGAGSCPMMQGQGH